MWHVKGYHYSWLISGYPCSPEKYYLSQLRENALIAQIYLSTVSTPW